MNRPLLNTNFLKLPSRITGGVLALTLIFSLSQIVLAQADESSRPPAKMLSPSVARELGKAQTELIEGNFAASMEILTALLDKGDRLDGFDRAKTYQIIAYAHVNQERYAEAVDFGEKALALNELDNESTLELLYQLAGLYLFQEKFYHCLKKLDLWLQLTLESKLPSKPEVYFMAAQALALQEKYPQAFDYAHKGMDLHRQQHSLTPDITPRKEWYQLQLAIVLNLEKYSAAVPLLQEMIGYWPDQYEFFLQLSAIYQELQQDTNSLAALSLAQQNGLMSKLEHFDRMLQLYRLRDYPYKGALLYAQTLETLDAAQSDEYVQNWEDLSNAWLQAREWQRAQKTLVAAAEHSSDGKNWLRLCQTAVLDEQWQQSIQFCQEALNRGGLGAEGATAWQQIALSHFYQEHMVQAIAAFDKCSQWQRADNTKPTVQQECSSWHKFVEKSWSQQQAQAQQMELNRQQAEERKNQLLEKIDSFAR